MQQDVMMEVAFGAGLQVRVLFFLIPFRHDEYGILVLNGHRSALYTTARGCPILEGGPRERHSRKRAF